MPRHRVILDTDIGDDIDDAFALALLLRCPELELMGVTTVVGGVMRRARTAEAMCMAAGAVTVPTLPGCRNALASRPVAGLNERPFHYGADADDADGAAEYVTSVWQLLATHATGRNALLAVGPLTNLAVAVTVDDRGRRSDLRLTVMGGEFQQERFVEHNVRCDPEAAHLVFASGLPIDVIPWSIGPATRLTDADVKRLEASNDRLVKLLVDWLRQFWRHVPDKTNMYDPMTVVALLRPDLFDWRRGRVTVELRDEALYGLTRFEPDDGGPHRVAFGVRADEAKAFMLDRILGG